MIPEYGCLPVTVTLALPLLSKIAEVADKTPFPSMVKLNLSLGTPSVTVTTELPLPEMAPLLEAVMSGEEIPKLVFALFPYSVVALTLMIPEYGCCFN